MFQTYITLFQILRLNVLDVAAEHRLGAAQAGEKPRQDLAPDCGHLHHLPLRQEHSHSLRDLREGSKGTVNATGKIKSFLPNIELYHQSVPVCSQILLIGHLLLSINSSVNFLVYSFGNSRKIFRFILGILGKTVASNREPRWVGQRTPVLLLLLISGYLSVHCKD